MGDRVDAAVWRHRLGAAALGALGLAGLTIALLGVFAVTNQLVGRRAHELGERIALGATPRAIVRLERLAGGARRGARHCRSFCRLALRVNAAVRRDRVGRRDLPPGCVRSRVFSADCGLRARAPCRQGGSSHHIACRIVHYRLLAAEDRRRIEREGPARRQTRGAKRDNRQAYPGAEECQRVQRDQSEEGAGQ